jgi:hypothetical protein
LLALCAAALLCEPAGLRRGCGLCCATGAWHGEAGGETGREALEGEFAVAGLAAGVLCHGCHARAVAGHQPALLLVGQGGRGGDVEDRFDTRRGDVGVLASGSRRAARSQLDLAERNSEAARDRQRIVDGHARRDGRGFAGGGAQISWISLRSNLSIERVIFAALGLYQSALGLTMIFAPDAFFDALGPFGVRNDHYIVDVGTLYLAAGVLFLGAVRFGAWRVPALVFGVVQWAVHTLNHLIDIDKADPHWVGVFDFVGLALGTAVLAWLLVRELRASRSRER